MIVADGYRPCHVSTSRLISSLFLEQKMTLEPSERSNSAMARPIPFVPPVITTFNLVNFKFKNNLISLPHSQALHKEITSDSIFMQLIKDLGKFVGWLPDIFSKPENWPMYYKETIRQMYDIGVGSMPIVILISGFIGAVTAIQFSYQLSGSFIPSYYIGYIVRDIMIIEMAATLTCIVLAGKVGSTMAAEIGGMRQKEHIDAMEIMGVNTSSYLVMPKLIASVMIIPLLVTIALIVGISGGYVAAVHVGGLTNWEFEKGLRFVFEPYNILIMYVKAITFSFIITSVACFQGYFVKGGSIELGHASTRAVVFGSIIILVADLIIALLLMG